MIEFLIVTGLAGWRIMRLIQTDTIFNKPRDWIFYRLAIHAPWIWKLLNCHYCLSVWIAVASFIIHYFFYEIWQIIGWTFAAAAIIALLAEADIRTAQDIDE